MRGKQLGYGICTLMICGLMSWGGAVEARADEVIGGPAFSNGDYVASIEAGDHPVYVSMDSYDVLRQATQGEAYIILADEGNGWMEVQVGDQTGYLSVEEEGVSVVEKDEIDASDLELAEIPEEETPTEAEISDSRRQGLVAFALQFVGGRYRAGGNDPHTGADCSGFVKYVMLHGAGVTIARSSASQSQQGVDVSADQMRPGDLIFYGKGGRVNHVAMYIGNGQVVHASTYKTGIKTSPWNYRAPMRIKNMLGD